MFMVLPKEPWYALYLSFCCQHGPDNTGERSYNVFNNMIYTLKIEHQIPLPSKCGIRSFCLKSKALEADVLGSRHNSGVQRPQMHKISVHGTDNRERDPQ